VKTTQVQTIRSLWCGAGPRELGWNSASNSEVDEGVVTEQDQGGRGRPHESACLCRIDQLRTIPHRLDTFRSGSSALTGDQAGSGEASGTYPLLSLTP
jgi:hypothetical protein